jgi:hypothetical protein
VHSFRRIVIAVALAAFLLVVAAIAVAKPITVTAGDLILTFDSSITPRALSEKTLSPITFKIAANISTKDGKHPPATTTFEADLDRNGALDAKGLPVCKAGQLEARKTSQAEAVCKGALIGKGTAGAEVEFAEQPPLAATGRLLVFNGGTKGGTTLILAHVYANVPAPTAFITRVYVTEEHRGKYGLHIATKIPVVAGGSGSLTHFEITHHKLFTYKGHKHSYFLAKCPTGRLFGQGELAFSDGTSLKGSVSVPCTPKS